jgi:hypothetical protein
VDDWYRAEGSSFHLGVTWIEEEWAFKELTTDVESFNKDLRLGAENRF